MTDRERIAEIVSRYHIGCNIRKTCNSECALCAADALIGAGYIRQPEPEISPYEIPHAAYDKHFAPPEPWDREQVIYEDGFKAGRKSWLLESKPSEPPVDKLEAIVVCLIARDEGINASESAKLWGTYKKTASTYGHYGDCTGEPMTCSQCLVENLKRDAREILALFSEYEPVELG